LVAAAIPDIDEDYILVEIAMPQRETPIETDRSCNIGRLAEVRLERTQWDWVTRLANAWSGTAERVAAYLP